MSNLFFKIWTALPIHNPAAGTLLQSQIRFRGIVQTKTEVREMFSQVPEVTLIFWIIKILATTLGGTGGGIIVFGSLLGVLMAFFIFAFSHKPARRIH
jgi:hypothetical protein